MKKRTKRIIRRIGLALLTVLLLFILAFFAVKALGRRAMLGKKDGSVQIAAPENADAVLEYEGETIIYQGQKYRYNENITCVLCMGVDKDDIEEGQDLIGNAGQADMLMLAILDTENGDINLWNISRDSMTDVDVYNVDGEYVRTENMQACLAFAYGDGSHGSCENTVRAVSRLLYGMPIQSYMVVDMDAIVPLNDAVGGVEVTIREGDILPEKFQPGTTMLLQGDDVEAYVRSRRTERPDEAIDSNNNRMARQKQYMMNFIRKALEMTKKDIGTPMNLFDIAMQDDHMVTNLNLSKIAYLTTIFSKVNFTEESFKTVPGEVIAGEKYAEFHVDDEALYQMILDTFYIKQ